MLYLRVWEGDETDWITVTPNNPDECDSSEFDQGQCTGFAVGTESRERFIVDFLRLMNKHHITVNIV